ncbi:MAG: hypothetical protein HYX53_13595 [Chloroflexi bacterium]|nr:hypothetical protein [Chloroflexota bacterium]
MLARTIEEAGIPTVIVTMMPALAEKFRLARIVGVEFPFGHAFGLPNDRAMQLEVARLAVRALSEAKEPGYRLDADIEWPIDTVTAYKDWQPAEASPIVKYNLERRARLEAAEGR